MTKKLLFAFLKLRYTSYLMLVILLVGVSITIYQVNRSQDSRSRAAGGTSQPPKGSFDGIDTTRWVAFGWALDPDTLDTITSTPDPVGYSTKAYIYVDLYVDNPAEGKEFIGRTVAVKYRPDLPKNINYPPYHGFEISIPEEYRAGWRKFYAYAIDSSGSGPNTLLKNSQNSALSYQTIGTKPNANSQISAIVDGSPLTISTADKFAGAIDSLTWKGKEFVDSYDHGREIQSAALPNGQTWGECFNPTEAGGEYDGTGNTSTSVLQALTASGNHLVTQTQMAYWAKANTYHENCGTQTNKIPPYPFNLSNYIMKKDVTIGFLNNNHIIDYKTSLTIPQHPVYNDTGYPNSFNWEAPTNYMPKAFSTIYTYDPATHTKTRKDPGYQGEVGFPVILTTPDEQYAMGVYSPLLPQSWAQGHGYKLFDLIKSNNVITSGCVYRSGEAIPGKTYDFQCYLVVGTVKDVTQGIDQIYDNPTVPPVPTRIPESTPTVPPPPTRTPEITPTSTPTPPLPQLTIENGGVTTTLNPWAIWLTGNNLDQQNAPFTAAVFGPNDALWQDKISVTSANTFVSFSLPNNIGPEGCNTTISPCQIQVQLKQTLTGFVSNKYSITLPIAPSNTPPLPTNTSVPPTNTQTVPTPSYLRSDFGGLGGAKDGKVDIQDFNILAGEFYSTGTNRKADIIKEGLSLNKVDIQDYNAFVGDYQAYLAR